MDKTLHQLVELLITALPTFLLIIFLNFYLKWAFVKPMEKVLRERYEATEGARKLAEESLQRADAKTSEYEAKLRAERSLMYQAQEKANQELQDRLTAAIEEERKRAEEAIRVAREQIAQDVETAKLGLAKDSETLANQIADTILRRNAA